MQQSQKGIFKWHNILRDSFTRSERVQNNAAIMGLSIEFQWSAIPLYAFSIDGFLTTSILHSRFTLDRFFFCENAKRVRERKTMLNLLMLLLQKGNSISYKKMSFIYFMCLFVNHKCFQILPNMKNKKTTNGLHFDPIFFKAHLVPFVFCECPTGFTSMQNDDINLPTSL